jgi:hypothetical protein
MNTARASRIVRIAAAAASLVVTFAMFSGVVSLRELHDHSGQVRMAAAQTSIVR